MEVQELAPIFLMVAFAVALRAVLHPENRDENQ